MVGTIPGIFLLKFSSHVKIVDLIFMFSNINSMHLLVSVMYLNEKINLIVGSLSKYLFGSFEMVPRTWFQLKQEYCGISIIKDG